MHTPYSLIVFLVLLGLACAEDAFEIKLPWGIYQGEPTKLDSDIIVFRNVRFGAEPKRFDAPSFPDWKNDSVQDLNRATACIQIDTDMSSNPPAAGNPLQDPHTPKSEQTEDCLFLDMYVPRWILEEKGDEKLPVVVWIYGGGYAFGDKNQGGPLYTGIPAVQRSDYSTIFVTGNHRVGAFGWLAGDYMQNHAQPNAGLYDQALLFEWVQKYIHQVKGDRNAVSAWGESAGAGSILHHLIREDGKRDPLFHSFVAQSPGYEWAWDNSPDGKLDTMYRNFSRLAGCDFSYNIKCLREKDKSVLAKANQDLYDLVRQTGLFPVGPAVDGKWIKTLAPVAFAKGKFWRANIASAIISNVANEGILFAPEITDDEQYETYLREFLPGKALAPQREAIMKRYDCKDRDQYLTYKLCVAKIITHAVFTCNSRDLATAYPGNAYMMKYEFPWDGLAFHGTDLIPEFMTSVLQATQMLMKLFEKIGLGRDFAEFCAQILNKQITGPLQTYLGSFAAAKDPNALSSHIHWPVVDDSGDAFRNVLTPRFSVSGENSWSLGENDDNTKSICSFWSGIAKDIISAASADEYDHVPSQDSGLSLEPESQFQLEL